MWVCYTVKLGYNELNGTTKSVRYNREGLCSKGTIWDQKSGVIFVRYSREFVITVIVITEFDCSYVLLFKGLWLYALSISDLHFRPTSHTICLHTKLR